MFLYKVLCILRVCLVLCPQIGYIHPDEHFQGPEIVYGDVLQCDVYRSWEFTTSKPIRSIVFPYFITALPAFFLKLLSYPHFKPGAYQLLVLPRLFMCMLSFFQDLCIYKICRLLNLKHESPLLFFASSYVTFVYLTRTFSNSLESVYFAVLLLLIIRALKLANVAHKQSKPYFLKTFLFLNFLSGMVCVFGLFNRPTFICFACLPMLTLLYLLVKADYRCKAYGIAALVLGCFSSVSCLTTIDSFYYSKINRFPGFNLSKVVFTPLHFFNYNYNPDNLANHGLHHRWIHFLVNIPLLFSVFGIILPICSLKNCFGFLRRYTLSFELLFLFSFLVPLVVFSTIPHQEPRFLVPLIIPLSLLLAFHQFSKPFLLVFLWVTTNLFCFYFYAFIHQAGVYASLEHLRSENTKYSIIAFHKTYMPPHYLLSLDQNQSTKLLDYAGSSIGYFKTGVETNAVNYQPASLYLVLPSYGIENYGGFRNLQELNYAEVKNILIFPHFSVENLPDLEDIENILLNKSPFISKIFQLKKLFSIQIIKFTKR